MSKHLGSHRYRTLFLSDLHLGTRGCQAHLILDMLRHVEADTIYLVGDIIDGWRLRAGWYWPQAHNDVVQKLLRKVRRGAKHGVRARQSRRVRAPVLRPDLRRHRDQAGGDPHRRRRQALPRSCTATSSTWWCATRSGSPIFGDWAYDTALFVNTHFNSARRAVGLPYWSFSAWAKLKVKNAVNFIGSFEKELAGEARRRGRRRRGLRAHPSRGHSRLRRRDLHKHRRLRRILLAGGRAFRWPVRGACAGRSCWRRP